jgi:hypothetical protein
VDDAESCALADRTNPAVRGATIQTLTVTALQDRPFETLADG